MDFKILSSMLNCLAAVAISGYAPALQATPKSAGPPKLLHTDYYGRTRKIILRNGWKPVDGPCMQVSESTCLHWPETGICSEDSPAFCVMSFMKKSQCLYITTRGDPPDEAHPGAGRVVDVAIRPSPCSKG